MAIAMNETKQGPLRIGVIGTAPLRIAGIESLLGADEGAEVVTLSVPGALDALAVSLIVVDADCTGHIFELLDAFRRTRPHLRVLVLGTPTEHDYIQRIIGAGAKGYLAHTAPEGEVRMAIQVVLEGSVWAPRKVMARLVESSTEQSRDAAEPKFTERELQVLRLLIAGRPNRAIASELGIDVMTVKAHVQRLMRKVGVPNRIALSVQAVSRNLLEY